MRIRDSVIASLIFWRVAISQPRLTNSTVPQALLASPVNSRKTQVATIFPLSSLTASESATVTTSVNSILTTISTPNGNYTSFSGASQAVNSTQNIPANGTGIEYARACNSALNIWSSSSFEYEESHQVRTQSVSFYEDVTTSYGSPDTTVCGYPYVTRPGIVATTTANITINTIVTTVAYPSPAPCYIDPNDCITLFQEYHTDESPFNYTMPLCEQPSVNDCSSHCAIIAGSARLLYWPVSAEPDRWCATNVSTITPAPTGSGPTTAVFEGITVTSPTFYLSVDSVWAYWVGEHDDRTHNGCGTSTHVLIPLSSQDVRTCRGSSTQGAHYNVCSYTLDVADFNGFPPIDAYGRNPYGEGIETITAENYNPVIVVPDSAIQSLFPGCTYSGYDIQALDPPHALVPASAMQEQRPSTTTPAHDPPTGQTTARPAATAQPARFTATATDGPATTSNPSKPDAVSQLLNPESNSGSEESDPNGPSFSNSDPTQVDPGQDGSSGLVTNDQDGSDSVQILSPAQSSVWVGIGGIIASAFGLGGDSLSVANPIVGTGQLSSFPSPESQNKNPDILTIAPPVPIINGNTLNAGTTTLVDGLSVSVGTGYVVVGHASAPPTNSAVSVNFASPDEPLINGTPVSQGAVITIGGESVSARVVVGGQTIKWTAPGSGPTHTTTAPAVAMVDGQILNAASTTFSNGLAVFVGAGYVVVGRGGNLDADHIVSLNFANSDRLLVNGIILTQGASTTIGGVPVSVGLGRVIVGSQTFELTIPRPHPTPITTVMSDAKGGSMTIVLIDATKALIDGTLVTLNGVTTVDGIQLSFRPGGIVVGSQTMRWPVVTEGKPSAMAITDGIGESAILAADGDGPSGNSKSEITGSKSSGTGLGLPASRMSAGSTSNLPSPTKTNDAANREASVRLKMIAIGLGYAVIICL